MKLNEMTTDQLADCLLTISEPAGRICNDAKVEGFFKRAKAHEKDRTMLAVYGDALSSALPALLKNHREDVYTILSALTGKTVPEIAAQNGVATIIEAKRLLDKDLTDFFTSFTATALNP